MEFRELVLFKAGLLDRIPAPVGSRRRGPCYSEQSIDQLILLPLLVRL